ncbi:MAG: hypothetical protein FWC79_08255 [Oscillospiraceae bacterium]|nr:hypothetical protein [Oscillospiraceae bacterium]
MLKENVIKVKDDTRLDQDINKLIGEKSLKSFFVKDILEKYETNEIDEETMKKVIEVGLEVL